MRAPRAPPCSTRAGAWPPWAPGAIRAQAPRIRRRPTASSVTRGAIGVDGMPTLLRAESDLRHPRRFLVSLIRDARRSAVLFEQLLLRSLRNTYRQSLLGLSWAFIPPIATAMAFALMGRAKVVSIATTDVPYTAFVIMKHQPAVPP